MIRKAVKEDIDDVENGYIETLRYEEEHGAFTAWKSGVYPTRQTAQKAVDDKSLYIMIRDGGQLYASMIINQTQPKEYNDINWKIPYKNSEILVLHLLNVNPTKAKSGIGKAMVQFAIDKAKRMKCKAIRLDTGSQNKPAISLYKKLGFEIVEKSTISIGGLIKHNDHLFLELQI